MPTTTPGAESTDNEPVFKTEAEITEFLIGAGVFSHLTRGRLLTSLQSVFQQEGSRVTKFEWVHERHPILTFKVTRPPLWRNRATEDLRRIVTKVIRKSCRVYLANVGLWQCGEVLDITVFLPGRPYEAIWRSSDR